MKKIFYTIVLALFSFSAANATPAYPDPIKVTQPDGSVITIRVHGDEYLNWITCGNSLVTKGSDGYYHYASFSPDGTSRAQGAIVRSTLSGDGSSVRPPQAAIDAAVRKRKDTAMKTSIPGKAVSNAAETHWLVLLIQFQDLSFTAADSSAANTAFSNMLNQNGYSDNDGTGSVKDYYTDNSHGAFNPVFDLVGPVTVDGTMSSYSADDGTTAQGAPRLLKEACEKLDDQIDFSQYDLDGDGTIDNVFFYFAGHNAAEGADGTIWPHASNMSYFYKVQLDGKYLGRYSCSSELKGSSGTTMAGIGTFCHEFGHTLGLPDFYDTDYETNGSGLALMTLSLMSSGNYNNNGRTPPYLTYEERHILGWDDGLTLLTEGVNTMSPISENKAYWCPTGCDDEYYLFESRPLAGWDAYTSTYTGGMVVYHIDKSDYLFSDGYTAAQRWAYGYGINMFSTHQCMDLVETVTPESALQYYAQLVFPGYFGVTELSSLTSPAMVAWNGTSTGYSLSEISFDYDTGISSVKVDLERQISGTVESLAGNPIAGVEITITPVENQISPESAPTATGSLDVSASIMKAGAVELKTVTGEDGTFILTIDSGGDYVLSAGKGGYESYSAHISVDVSKNVTVVLPTIQETAGTELKKYKNITSYGWGSSSRSGWDFYAGLHFPADSLVSRDCVGSDILSISFMAGNGGDGIVQEMGVKVLFDEEEVLSRAVSVPVFNAMCTVDISDAGLTVPEGRSVTFVYYLLKSTYGYPIKLADVNSADGTGGGYYIICDGGSWNPYMGWDNIGNTANVIISALVSDHKAVLKSVGFNTIAVKSGGYSAGDTFDLELVESTSNPPSEVSWKVNGESVSGTQVVLSAGTYVIQAYLTYSSGRKECVETSILVE